MLDFVAKKVGAAMGLNAPPPPRYSIPEALPGLKASSGADLAKVGGFSPKAGAKPPEQMSPAAYMRTALNEQGDAIPATRALAHNLPPDKGVLWAVDSCKSVDGQMTQSDLSAMNAAEAYLANPTARNRLAAGQAAAGTDFQGPGAFAAQAAALSGPKMPVPSSPGALAAAENPAAECVAGAVMIAAALKGGLLKPGSIAAPAASAAAPIPSAPVVATAVVVPSQASPEMAHALKPFIDRGLQLAAGTG